MYRKFACFFFDEHFKNCYVTPKAFHKAIDKEGFNRFIVDIVNRLAAMKPSSHLPSVDYLFYVFTDALRVMDIVVVSFLLSALVLGEELKGSGKL